jgi:hypothetical protein
VPPAHAAGKSGPGAARKQASAAGATRYPARTSPMNDRDFCNRSARLAADTVRDKFAHLAHGAVEYAAFGPGIVLFFGNTDRRTGGRPPVVAKLREFLAIEEVGIRELGFGITPDRRTWAMLTESRRDVSYCRRLVAKADREVLPGRPNMPGSSSAGDDGI